jgi:hypothetical protein
MPDQPKNPILEAVIQVVALGATAVMMLPEAEQEILKRRLLDKAWICLNRCARWLGGKSMQQELRTGVQNYHLPLLVSRIRDWTLMMYEKSKAKIL